MVDLIAGIIFFVIFCCIFACICGFGVGGSDPIAGYDFEPSPYYDPYAPPAEQIEEPIVYN